MSEHNINPNNYSQEFINKITQPYPHDDCPCVECEHVYLHNMGNIVKYQPCANCGEPATKLTETSKNAFCTDCTKTALDNAFSTLQTSLGISPETGKPSNTITDQQKADAKNKLNSCM